MGKPIDPDLLVCDIKRHKVSVIDNKQQISDSIIYFLNKYI